MDQLSKHLIEIIKIMDEMAAGSIELSLDFQNGTKRKVKVVIDGDDE